MHIIGKIIKLIFYALFGLLEHATSFFLEVIKHMRKWAE